MAEGSSEKEDGSEKRSVFVIGYSLLALKFERAMALHPAICSGGIPLAIASASSEALAASCLVGAESASSKARIRARIS